MASIRVLAGQDSSYEQKHTNTVRARAHARLPFRRSRVELLFLAAAGEFLRQFTSSLPSLVTLDLLLGRREELAFHSASTNPPEK